MIDLILCTIFILLLIFYALFLYSVLRGLDRLEIANDNRIPDEFVSVIIPFRNESENIIANVEGLLIQDYPEENFEVIYVDDNSADDSLKKLNEVRDNNNIKVLSLPGDYSSNAHKKRAISYGIENSRGEIIVTTDADCVHSSGWLSSLLNNFDDGTGFVSGPVEFIKEKKLFSRIQKLEFGGLVITGAGLIGAGRPTICNAANIAYKRKVYDEVNGFYDHMNLSSGDDELLMQKIVRVTKYKVRFSLNKNSIVRTKSNSSISQFYQQRKRWASKGLFYKNFRLIFTLILIYLFYLGLIIQPFLFIINSTVFAVTFGLSVIVKFLLEFLILRKGRQILFNDLKLNLFLVAEILQVPYIIITGFAGMFGNLVWKNREIKR